MSIYVMTVGELAKKRGEPVGDFVKKVQSVGFDAGSHAKKLTQQDLDSLIKLLDNTETQEVAPRIRAEKKRAVNPNVLMIKLSESKTFVAHVDASLNDDGSVNIEVLESSVQTSIGETLLEFRKQLGIKMGVM